MKTRQIHLPPMILTVVALAVIAMCPACDSKPKGSTQTSSPERTQAAKPPFNAQKTELLSRSITNKDLGSKWGRIEMKPQGLLIHPGDTPTTIEFDVEGKFPDGKLNAWMVKLPSDVISSPRAAGSANITVFCDNRKVASAKVDRASNLSQSVNLSGVSRLKIVVDNAGDGSFWDGLHVGVE